MKRIAVAAAAALALAAAGCFVVPYGGIYTDVTAPANLAHGSVYQVTPASDFETVAVVQGEARGTVILGLIATGDFGYGAAIRDALAKAPGATRLIDVVADLKVKNILGVYAEYITRVSGRAIRTP